MIVAYQGEPGAFSELAARRTFGSRTPLLPCPTFADVFDAVQHGRARAGVVPVENTVFGPIHETRDLLAKARLVPVGEVTLRIRLCLLGLPSASVGRLRTIRSQPQALGQCGAFLRSLPRVRVESVHDTAAAARTVCEQGDPTVACVAGRQAARPYGLRVLRDGVEDDARNYTRFLVIEKRRKVQWGMRPSRAATTLVVASLLNTPGSLHRFLGAFASARVNLRTITSRPQPGRPWEYLFHLDLDGSTGSPRVRGALEEAGLVCIFLRVLGCYPRGRIYRR